MKIFLTPQTLDCIRGYAYTDIREHEHDYDYADTVRIAGAVRDAIPYNSTGTVEVSEEVLGYILERLDECCLQLMKAPRGI